MYDLVLKNGTVADGSGNPSYRADICVKDGLIAEIDRGEAEKTAKETLDCSGFVIAPGFIDNHSHSDEGVLLGIDSYNLLEQGVTTEITGNCGIGQAPVYGESQKPYRRYFPEERCREIDRACSTMSGFLEAAEQMELGTNMAFLAGENNIRGSVMGYSSKKPDRAQMDQMCARMNEAMEAGYLGLSTGLVYAPSVYAGKEELTELAKITKKYGGIYASHIRNEGNRIFSAVREAIELGKASGVPVTVSHLKIIGKENAGRAEELLGMLEQANSAGIRVRADQYPYTAGSAALLSQMPPRFLTNGPAAFLERLRERAFRREVQSAIFEEADTFESGIYSCGWDACLIGGALKTAEAVGKTIGELAHEREEEPMDVCCDLLLENDCVVQGIYFSQNEPAMLEILRHPLVCCGTDWGSYRKHYAVDHMGGEHPRGTAAMPRRLELLRKHGYLSMEEAVHSITGRAAQTSALADQIGLLQCGRAADICVFDWKNIRAHADYTHPFLRSQGIQYVLVNGKVSVRDGQFTGVRAGRVLRRDSGGNG